MTNNAFRTGNRRGAKINAEIAAQIRADLANGMTQGAACRKYGLSIAQIGRISRGEVWNQPPHRADAPDLSEENIEKSLLEVLEKTKELRTVQVPVQSNELLTKLKQDIKTAMQGEDLLNELTREEKKDESS